MEPEEGDPSPSDEDMELELELQKELQRQVEDEDDDEENDSEPSSEPSNKRHKQEAQQGEPSAAAGGGGGGGGECSCSSSSALSFEDLAPELIVRVLLHLSAQDLASVAQVCKGLHEISQEDLLWKRLYSFRWEEGKRGTSSRHISGPGLESDNVHLSGDLDLDVTFRECMARGRGRGEGEREGEAEARLPRFVWRGLYLERARSTLKDSLHGACDVMKKHILQMHAHLWAAQPLHDPDHQWHAMEGRLGLFFDALAGPDLERRERRERSLSGGGRGRGRGRGGGFECETTEAAGIDRQRQRQADGERMISSSSPSSSSSFCSSIRTIHELVDKYRREHQMSSQGDPRHKCSSTQCVFHKLRGCRNVFICESSGNFHVCDRKCKLKEYDHRHEIYVCTISGHVFDGEVAHHDLSPDDPDLRDPDGLHHVTEGMHFDSKMDGGSNHKTWLANAYEAGYFAENLEELKATF